MDDFNKLLLVGIIALVILIFLARIFRKIAIHQAPKEEVYVYIIENTYLHDTKIGISNKPEKRIRQLQTGSSRPLKIRHIIKFNTRYEATKVEEALHKKYSKHRLTGEWFDIDYRKVIKYVEDKYDQN